jgi:hypothetical protein
VLKAFAAIVAAAAVAGGITILSAPVGDVAASTLPPRPRMPSQCASSVPGPIQLCRHRIWRSTRSPDFIRAATPIANAGFNRPLLRR